MQSTIVLNTIARNCYVIIYDFILLKVLDIQKMIESNFNRIIKRVKIRKKIISSMYIRLAQKNIYIGHNYNEEY